MRALPRRALGATLAAGLAAVLAGCSPPGGRAAQIDPPGPKEVTVVQDEHAHVVPFRRNAFRLEGRAVADLMAFLADIDAGVRDPVRIFTDSAMMDRLARQRARRVASRLREAGYRDVTVRPPGPVGSGMSQAMRERGVLVRVRRYRAEVPACPDLSRPTLGGYRNLTSSNYGCATARNLGEMVAEPRDLTEGRDPGDADGARQRKAIEAYREGDVATPGGTGQGGATSGTAD